MKTLTRGDRQYPCRHALAQFGNVDANTVAPRRCPTCGTKYKVTFYRASSHVLTLTGTEVWRARWDEA